MLRFIIRRSLHWRYICTTLTKFNKVAEPLPVLNLPKVNQASDTSISLDKVELTPAIHSEPFKEIPNDDKDFKDEVLTEFVDSLAPPLPISFNLAAYVNDSETLQKLVQLGVDLSELEKKAERAKFIVTLDFEKDIKNHIKFLHDNGVSADDLGHFITRNPFIFKESVEHLEVRINYLKSKNFTYSAIAHIITRNPLLLNLETKQVDKRLGFFQRQLDLTGNEVRHLITKGPKLVTCKMDILLEKMFCIKEEMGYSADEMKKLLLSKPKIWMLGRRVLTERFHIVHNTMGISHEIILETPEVFLTRGFKLKQRHLYLAHLKRDQYDPNKPLYVPLKDIAIVPDGEFCSKYAKTSVTQFNEFLMTL